MKFVAGVALALCVSTSAFAAERLPPIPLDKMSAEQKPVAEKIMGSRNRISGPFNVLLRSPELADRLQNVGAYVRYNSVIPKNLSEFAIMVTARQWNSQLEWHLHYPEATGAGVKPQVLADLAAQKRPAGMSADEDLVYDFATALHRDKGHMNDALFEKARTRFGEKGVVDLIGINGYYAAVAMTINAGNVPLPEGAKAPW